MQKNATSAGRLSLGVLTVSDQTIGKRDLLLGTIVGHCCDAEIVESTPVGRDWPSIAPDTRASVAKVAIGKRRRLPDTNLATISYRDAARKCYVFDLQVVAGILIANAAAIHEADVLSASFDDEPIAVLIAIVLKWHHVVLRRTAMELDVGVRATTAVDVKAER